MSYRSGFGFGTELCQAIGIDPKGVSKLSIDIACDEAVTVTVDRWVKCKDVTDMTDKYKRFVAEHVITTEKYLLSFPEGLDDKAWLAGFMAARVREEVKVLA